MLSRGVFSGTSPPPKNEGKKRYDRGYFLFFFHSVSIVCAVDDHRVTAKGRGVVFGGYVKVTLVRSEMAKRRFNTKVPVTNVYVVPVTPNDDAYMSIDKGFRCGVDNSIP